MHPAMTVAEKELQEACKLPLQQLPSENMSQPPSLDQPSQSPSNDQSSRKPASWCPEELDEPPEMKINKLMISAAVQDITTWDMTMEDSEIVFFKNIVSTCT